MQYQILNSITEIEAQHWNEFVSNNGGSVFHTYEWLLSYEVAAPHNSKVFHIIMKNEDGEWFGLIPVFATKDCPRFNKWRLRVVEHPITIPEPTLLSHTLYSFYGYPLVVNDKKELYMDLLKGFKDLALKQKIPVYGFTGVPENRKVLLDCLHELGFTSIIRSASSLINIQWETYDEYLKSLPRKVRTDVNWMKNKYEREGVKLRIDDPYEHIEELNHLITTVLLNHNNTAKTELFPRQYIERIIHEFKDKVFLITAYKEDDVLYMNLCFIFNQMVIPWTAGIAYDKMGNISYHYFYAWVIKYAIEHGYKTVDCGRSAYKEKEKYGYQRTKLYFCLVAADESVKEELIRWLGELEEYSLKRVPQ